MTNQTVVIKQDEPVSAGESCILEIKLKEVKIKVRNTTDDLAKVKWLQEKFVPAIKNK